MATVEIPRQTGSRARERTEELYAVLAERVLVLDGATGTGIQARDLTAADFGGPDYEGCNEHLVFTRPDVVADLHAAYFEAGADMVETDTFGGTPLVLAEYGLADKAIGLNREAARIAREVAHRFRTTDRPRFVAGSMGPTTKSITVTGGVTFAEMIRHYRVQATGLLEGGADVLVLETVQDTRNLKAGLIAVEQAFAEVGWRIPIMVSATIEAMGTMLAGQTIEAFYASVMHAPLLSVGLNCGTGPEFMTSHLRSLSALARTRVSCYPNAGLPDEEGRYCETPETLVAIMGRFLEQGLVDIVGGCCGTTPAHSRALAAAAAGRKPRRTPEHRKTLVSGIEMLEVNEDNRPVLVGERTNVLGSRKFKRLVAAGEFEAAAEIARAQVKNGAQVIDVCLQDPDRDEVADVNAFLERATKMVKVPLMLDSTDAKVLELGLEWSQGKSIINSINLEDGEERFRAVVPLAQRYGAALIVGTIDEDPVHGMGVTRERKLEIARRSYTLLTEKYGVAAEDIIFDPLVFPCGTGDEKYVGSAAETVEGVRAIKAALPECKTILGISNVSFGLPEAGREVLNSVFLYHCVKAGLDLAIVNSEKQMRYPSIPEEERRLCEDLLFNRGEDPIGAFALFYKSKTARPKTAERPGTSVERLPRYIVEGSKEGLIADLEAVRGDGMAPLDIINGPLMDGMREVGRLFNDNELIVAEVLQSAEAMKAAVGHLQQFMEKTTDSLKGKIVLATVKGDVHDIGKNLVEIILSNNGYEVINLGIKVAPEALVQAYRAHQPDAIGLSGLLVKSAQQMVTTAQDLTSAGVTPPLLVGGAALSQRFTDNKIAPAYGGLVVYAEDAMRGLALADRVLSGDEARTALAGEAEERRRSRPAVAEREVNPLAAPEVRNASIEVLPPVAAPDFEEHVFGDVGLDRIWRYVNPHMLYSKHLGLRGSYWRLKEAGDEKLLELEELADRIRRSGWVLPRAMYRFYEAYSEGNSVNVVADGRSAARFTFPRQATGERLCLADFVRPRQDGLALDTVALLVTTAGEGIRRRAEELKHEGEYLLCHALQAIAVEAAEGAAEWIHQVIRESWGFPDPPETTMMDRFQARYRGKRYSAGYPAWPELSDQTTVFRLVDGRKIGVDLTEGFMMDPEASVSALAVHHPQARYFAA
jgi:5-methyltetrahydrofolate--homocysteine methyltransferase